MRVIVLTSTFRRHNFLINRLAAELDVVGVWQEEKSFQPASYARTADDAAVIARHFSARDAAEASYFAGHERTLLPRGAVCRRITAATINDSAEVARMEACRPDVVAVFGTGLLREPILHAFDGQFINLHLGLSPYYRGAGTNFWPLVNRKPEYVGATIHYLDAGIDTGPIIAHRRPCIECRDGPHDIGNKAIAAAVETGIGAIRAHVEGRVRARPQTQKGRLYQRKDFSADALRDLHQNFTTGMISEYLDHQSERDSRLALVTLPTEA